jgi:hypothetical protein
MHQPSGGGLLTQNFWRRVFSSRHPPEGGAQAILASNGYITGQTVQVNGGMYPT